MQQKIKNLKKSTKVLLVFLVALILVASATGITLYTQEINNRVLQTQEAYWGLVIPDAADYDKAEQIELQKLLDSREFMFNNLHFTDLQNLQQDFDVLDQQVKNRIEIDKKYATKKVQAESINVLDGANVAEQEIFNARKNEVLTLIESRNSFEEIEVAMKALKDTNKDIQTRIDNEEANVNQGGNWSSSEGDYTPNAPRQNNNNNQGGEKETCRVMENGATTCVGNGFLPRL